MIEINNPEINFDELMNKTRDDAARQREPLRLADLIIQGPFESEADNGKTWNYWAGRGGA